MRDKAKLTAGCHGCMNCDPTGNRKIERASVKIQCRNVTCRLHLHFCP